MTTATLTHPTAASATAVSGRPLSVLIADDHPPFRRGIARAIRRDPHLKLVGERSAPRSSVSGTAAVRTRPPAATSRPG